VDPGRSPLIVPDPPCVLLVEADQELRERVGEALHANGFVPLLAADAIDAVEQMTGASVPVLAILDLDLLGRPAELLAHFKADARWSCVPVIVPGSAADIPGQMQVDGLLPKPFEFGRLVSLARESVALVR
jgi:DNA-binding response OmpR family regulator